MATAEVNIEDQVITIVTDFSEKDLVRAVPGSRWNPKTKVWHAPLSWATCVTMRGLFRDRLVVGPNLQAWAWNERQRRIEPANEIRQVTAWAGGAQIDADLYSFQDVGVEFLVRAEHALLADEMGTGKTVQTIRALRRLSERDRYAYPVCIICPNTVKRTWEREFNRWDPKVEVYTIQGSAANRRKIFEEAAEASIVAGRDIAVVINIEAVRLHSRVAPYGNIRLSEGEKERKELQLIPFRSVVVDECHRMKEPKAKQTRAIWAVQHMPSVKFRFGLTGTPIANHVGDLWSIMHGLAPEDYPGKTAFIDRFCMMSWNPFGALEILGVRPDTQDEFYSILNPRMRRMPKELVLPFLPKKVREVRDVELSPKQLKAYRDIDDQMITRLDDGQIMVASNPLSRNTRLLQFSSAYATVDEAGEVHLSEPSPKLDAMEEIIDDLGEESIVIVAESRQLIDLAAVRLDKSGVTYRMITGAVADVERQRGMDDFQAGQARVMLMTIKAGGVGITLTKAGVIIFLQRSWSMVDNRQAEDRVHRIGSEIHDKIVVIDMIAANTIEETQIPQLHLKLQRLEQIVRDREVLAANGDHAAVARLDQEMAAIEQIPLWTGVA